jgi:hypothetical protein
VHCVMPVQNELGAHVVLPFLERIQAGIDSIRVAVNEDTEGAASWDAGPSGWPGL